ncbi:MAG: spirocyclase AveC family protein [Solirubrobacteraceae bacterium]
MTGIPIRPEASVGRPAGAIKAWAAVGLVAIVVIAQGIGRWVGSSQFAAAPKGSDRYGHLAVLRVVEVISALFLLYFFVTCVVAPLVRRRRFEFDGMLLLGCLAVHFFDPLFNYFSPTFLQNAYSLNAGSWANFIPGYASPSGNAHYVEGVLWAAALYGLFGIAAAKIGGWLLGRMRRRWPGAGNFALYSVLFAVFAAGDLIVENFFVREQIYIFWGAWSPITLWAGKVYQFPLYETVLATVYALGFVWLRDSRDDRGRSWVERGVDRVQAPRRARTAMSFCAIVAFSLVWALGSYFGWYMAISMKANSFPPLPSYLRAGAFCGLSGEPLCPSQFLARESSRFRTG